MLGAAQWAEMVARFKAVTSTPDVFGMECSLIVHSCSTAKPRGSNLFHDKFARRRRREVPSSGAEYRRQIGDLPYPRRSQPVTTIDSKYYSYHNTNHSIIRAPKGPQPRHAKERSRQDEVFGSQPDPADQ